MGDGVGSGEEGKESSEGEGELHVGDNPFVNVVGLFEVLGEELIQGEWSLRALYAILISFFLLTDGKQGPYLI